MKMTVTIALYNKKDYIKRALDSVLCQTHSEFELIVVNDGSTDGGEKIVETYSDPRIRMVHQKNAGLPTARNVGIEHATSEWVAFLDADDYWLPHCLQSHVENITAHPDICWSAGFNREIKPDGSYVDRSLHAGVADLYDDGVISDGLLFLCRGGGLLQANVVCVKKAAFAVAGLHDPVLRNTEDVDMWLRLSLHYPRLAHCNKVISVYFLDVPNSQVKNIETKYKFTRIVLDKHKHLLRTLPEPRQSALRGYMRRIINNLIVKQLLIGNRENACQTCVAYREVLSPARYAGYMVCAHSPAMLPRLILGVKKIARTMLGKQA